MMGPRQTPSRDEFYMGLAMFMAGKSKDPSTQIGSVIVSKDNFPLGWGYNGPPKNVADEEVDWSRPNKYDWIIHAEENAIDHSSAELEGATIYVTAKPCKGCMLRIVNKGIVRVVYYPYNPKDKKSTLADKSISDKTDEIAAAGGVKLDRFESSLSWVEDRYDQMKTFGIL
jgi:dCMP deaminase